jgi:hypothetical protein
MDDQGFALAFPGAAGYRPEELQDFMEAGGPSLCRNSPKRRRTSLYHLIVFADLPSVLLWNLPAFLQVFQR